MIRPPGSCQLLLSWSLVCLGEVCAQDKPDTVTQIEGTAVTGLVQSIGSDGAVAVRRTDGTITNLALGAVRMIEFGRRNPAPVPRQGMILFRSGVEMPATLRECSGRSLVVTSPLLEGEVKFSLTRVQAIRFVKLPAADQGGFGRYLRAPKEEKDLLYFKAGERIVPQSVTVEGFEDGKDQLVSCLAPSRRRELRVQLELRLAASAAPSAKPACKR